MRSLAKNVLVLLTAVACVGVTLSGAHSQVPVPEGYPAAGAPSIVKLVSAGAAPRQPLRYRIPAGHKDVMLMTTAISMSMAGMSMDLPVMKMTAEVGVTNVAANGDISFDLTFTDVTAEATPGMDPSVAAMIQNAVGGMKGLKGAAVVSDRGLTRSARFGFDQLADPNLKQMLSSVSTSLESLSLPFPEEAVGAGAHWEVRQNISSSGARVFQKADYEIVSIDGPAVSFRLKVEQTAPPQMISNPALPEGVTMEMQSLTSSGTGTMALRLDSLVPTSEVSSSSSTVSVMSMGGNTQQLAMDTKMKITIGPGR